MWLPHTRGTMRAAVGGKSASRGACCRSIRTYLTPHIYTHARATRNNVYVRCIVRSRLMYVHEAGVQAKAALTIQAESECYYLLAGEGTIRSCRACI
jgi:hypothetical protein